MGTFGRVAKRQQTGHKGHTPLGCVPLSPVCRGSIVSFVKFCKVGGVGSGAVAI